MQAARRDKLKPAGEQFLHHLQRRLKEQAAKPTPRRFPTGTIQLHKNP
jgi:hypothetical protein